MATKTEEKILSFIFKHGTVHQVNDQHKITAEIGLTHNDFMAGINSLMTKGAVMQAGNSLVFQVTGEGEKLIK